MNTQELQEKILQAMVNGESSIRSPYKLHGNPPMWDLFSQDGITTAIRPAIVQERIGQQWQEVTGISWGKHQNGEWVPGVQHQAATMDWFIERTLRPALEAGATFCEISINSEEPSP